jgi:hypothetical protein
MPPGRRFLDRDVIGSLSDIKSHYMWNWIIHARMIPTIKTPAIGKQELIWK